MVARASHGGDRSEISARLTRIEALATRTTSSTEAKISDDISARIAKLEAALNAPPVNNAAPLVARIGTLETSVKAVLEPRIGPTTAAMSDHAAASREMRAQLEAARQAVSDLRVTVERQASGAGDKGELDRMAARVGALETATKTVQQNIDPQQGISADRAVRRALLATALRERVTRGGPFAAELTAVKAVSDDAGSLAPLEPFAARGLPPADAFCAELAAILPRISPPRDGAPRGNTFVERLQARASQLVRIRPIGETAGDDAATVLGRVELKAARGDVDGALADLLRLPAETRAPAADWISRAQARQAALAGTPGPSKPTRSRLSGNRSSRNDPDCALSGAGRGRGTCRRLVYRPPRRRRDHLARSPHFDVGRRAGRSNAGVRRLAGGRVVVFA